MAVLATSFTVLPSFTVSIMEATSTLANGRRRNLESPMFLALTSISMKLAGSEATQLLKNFFFSRASVVSHVISPLLFNVFLDDIVKSLETENIGIHLSENSIHIVLCR